MVAPPLFKRLPDRLFGPLAAPNRHQYWDLLCRLYASRFGPDAPLQPAGGVALREVNQDIENFLVAADPWAELGEEEMTAPINIRAAMYSKTLRDAGWLVDDRIGVIDSVYMKPAVAQFLGSMIEFAETGPIFVSSKMRTIELHLQQVTEGSASGDSLREAATQARQLLLHVAATSLHVREITESLDQAISAADFAHIFFTDYVERLFIGDYQQLTGVDHPIARRSRVVEAAESLMHDVERTQELVQWYSQNLCKGSAVRAREQFENDIRRLLELDRIGEHLRRLDFEVNRANRRANAYIDYRLRSPKKLDALLQAAISAAISAPKSLANTPFAPGPLMAPDRLREPRTLVSVVPRGLLRPVVLTAEQRAVLNLLHAAKNARLVNPVKLAGYVARHLQGTAPIPCESLQISSVSDFRAYQTLLMMAVRAEAKKQELEKTDDSLLSMARGYSVRLRSGNEFANEYLTAPAFEVTPHGGQHGQ